MHCTANKYHYLNLSRAKQELVWIGFSFFPVGFVRGSVLVVVINLGIISWLIKAVRQWKITKTKRHDVPVTSSRTYLSSNLQNGGNHHGHVPAFVQVHGLKQAVVGHAVGIGTFQKQLDVFHLWERNIFFLNILVTCTCISIHVLHYTSKQPWRF